MRREDSDTVGRAPVVGYVTYYTMLTLFLLASFFPEYRVWGVNWWAYFPVYVPMGLFVFGALVPLGLHFVRKNSLAVEERNGRDRLYYVTVACLTAVLCALFYFLRTRTHFLGDGYTLLALMSEDKPLIKYREIGEVMTHVWLKNAIGGNPEYASLLSFRIVSIVAGGLFLLVLAISAKTLLQQNRVRLLFWMGIASSGYMLLFFGYVENYSLFAAAVLTYTIVGIFVCREKVSRSYIVLPLAAAIIFHIMGVTLIPSAVYILVSGTNLADRLGRLRISRKLLLTIITGIPVALLFYYFYSNQLFFRFSLLPLVENRFTVEGYTLFSWKHLVDFINMLLLYLPGLPVLVVGIPSLSMRDMVRRRTHRYLILLVLSSLGAAFIFDPKIGMARDWDLFAFSGITLSVALYYTLARCESSPGLFLNVMVLSITLGLLSLFPRVVTLMIPNVMISHYKAYLEHDTKKNRNAAVPLIEYYLDRGMIAEAEETADTWRTRVPEIESVQNAAALLKEGHVDTAVSILRAVLRENPSNWQAWGELGNCFYQLDLDDSALSCFRIAAGITPHNVTVKNNLAYACFYTDDLDRAEELWLEVLRSDSNAVEPLIGLSLLYQKAGNARKYSEYFFRAAAHQEATAEILKTLGNYYLSVQDYQNAARAFERALDKGLDTGVVKAIVNQHSQLVPYFEN